MQVVNFDKGESAPRGAKAQSGGALGIPEMLEAVKELLETDEISQSKLAREAGTSSAYISQWVAGKLPQSYIAGLERKLVIWWENRSVRIRTRSLLPDAPRFLDIPTSRKIMQQLEWAQMAQDVVMVYSGAGYGKSTAAEEYKDRHANVWIVEMKQDCSRERPCLEEIALIVGGCLEASGKSQSSAEIRRSICGRIRNTRGLLVIDEAQFLSCQALQEVRGIYTSTGVGLALMGNEELYVRAKKVGSVWSRIGQELKLEQLCAADIEGLAAAYQVSGKAELKKLEGLATRDGGLRRVVKALRKSAMIARRKKESCNLKHLETASRQLFNPQAEEVELVDEDDSGRTGGAE